MFFFVGRGHLGVFLVCFGVFFDIFSVILLALMVLNGFEWF